MASGTRRSKIDGPLVHAKRGKDGVAEADRREAQRLTPDPMLALPKPRSAGDVKGD
jgi:hypothetical protein